MNTALETYPDSGNISSMSVGIDREIERKLHRAPLPQLTGLWEKSADPSQIIHARLLSGGALIFFFFLCS
jgi:hypothetical protein